MQDRLDRLQDQRGIKPEDALARIESQASDEERRAVAQFIIANGGDLEALLTPQLSCGMNSNNS